MIIVPVTTSRGLVLVSTVILYSRGYDATVMNDDNLMTALPTQIQVSIVLISRVRKPPVKPIALAKW